MVDNSRKRLFVNLIIFGDFFNKTYPALPGGSKALIAECVCRSHSRQATTMGAHIPLPIAIISKFERKVDSLPPAPLGLEHARNARKRTSLTAWPSPTPNFVFSNQNKIYMSVNRLLLQAHDCR
jgi:hypothetical protein